MAQSNSTAVPSAPLGCLYGIGVGPGDPEWMTVKGARLLGACRHVCVPRARKAAESVALQIAGPHLRPDAVVHQITFPMTADAGVLHDSWRKAAEEILAILSQGEDVCFLTLGDPLLYSTYIYLLSELRALRPELRTLTVPGVNAFSAAAAVADFPIGCGREPVTIVPAVESEPEIERALDAGGTVVLMKVGERLQAMLDLLERRELLEQTVFVSHVGLPEQRVEKDVRRLRGAPEKTGYLSILLVRAGAGRTADRTRDPDALSSGVRSGAVLRCLAKGPKGGKDAS